MLNRTLRRLAVGALVGGILAASAVPALAAIPTNDDIASPVVVDSIPYTNAQDTTDATTGPTDVDCAGSGPTVWYEYTPTSDLRLEANTFGSDYDTTLAVGLPDGAGGLAMLACNDDAGGDLQSRIRLDAEAGVTYLFQIGSFASGPGGNLVVNIDEALPVAPLTIDLTVDSTARFDSAGGATISGSVSCSGTDGIFMELLLSQRVGRFILRGYGDAFVECSTTPSPWQVRVSSPSGRFGGGMAQLALFAGACNDEECTFVEVERAVTLRR